MRVVLTSILLCLSLSGCAHSPTHETERDKAGGTTPDPRTVGETLARRGRFMEASFFFEAAISRGADETEVLPLLIASQVQSNRLRAAKQNVVRLAEISGWSAPLDELLTLLARYTPAVGTAQQGVAP